MGPLFSFNVTILLQNSGINFKITVSLQRHCKRLKQSIIMPTPVPIRLLALHISAEKTAHSTDSRYHGTQIQQEHQRRPPRSRHRLKPRRPPKTVLLIVAISRAARTPKNSTIETSNHLSAHRRRASDSKRTRKSRSRIHKLGSGHSPHCCSPRPRRRVPAARPTPAQPPPSSQPQIVRINQEPPP